jgi:purine-binding chemotaxis protein CheW
MERENGVQQQNSQYLTFDIDDERYAVDVTQVEVVLEMAPITRVPKSPEHIRGVINHRGSVIPVVDLRSIFGVGPGDSALQPSIVVTQVDFEGESLTAGILADAVHEVVDLDRDSTEAAPPYGQRSNASAFVRGIGKRDGRFLILLDLERALSATAAEQEIT